MSSKIYFTDKASSRSLSYYLVKAVSSSLIRIAPKFARKQTKKLLLTPVRSRKREQLPSHFETSQLNTAHGKLNITSVGEGKTIVLTHGWSGSSAQFYPLMEKIAASGYRALAFDHFGHGQSGGRFANLPLFIKGLHHVLQQYSQQIIGVVSHSMGTVAALNVAKDLPHVLIAPTFGFYDSFESRILSTGISKKAFLQVLSEVETEHNMTFNSMLPEQHIANHQYPITAVHDKDDKYAPFHLSEQQAELHPAFRLHAIEGKGHGRIINCDQTWAHIENSLLR